MDIRGLNYFISLAESLNFTRAAKDCFITQTAMSLHIAKMEEELGFKLFNRSNRKVELTAGGKVFYEHAVKIVSSYEEAVRQSLSAASGKNGSVHVLFTSYIEEIMFSGKLAQFRDENPQIDVTAELTEPRLVIEKLTQEKADIAVCRPYEMENSDIQVEVIREEPVYVLINKKHKLAKEEKITKEMLASEQLVVWDPKGVPQGSRVMREDWTDSGLEPAGLMKTNLLEEMIPLVELEHGIALFPKYVYAYSHVPYVKSCVSRPLDLGENTPKLKLAAGYLKSNKNPMCKALVELLKQGDEKQEKK